MSDHQLHGVRVVTCIATIFAIAAGLFAEIIFDGDIGNRIASAGVRAIPMVAGLGVFVEIAIDRRRKASANVSKAAN